MKRDWAMPRWRRLFRQASTAALATLLAVAVGAPSAQELPVPCSACAGVSNFVTSGAATYSVSGSVGTVRQHTDRAILNWEKFNIGAGGTVNFRQPSSTSAALNRIHQNDPSRILGNLNANGQVYLINQNGIVFGSGAQVNTRALTASTLNVSNEVFDTHGITGAINQPLGDKARSLPAFEGESKGGIRIERGAKLRAGERVVIVSHDIENRGSIETPDGQTILAGSHDKVYVATDKELGGWLVEVDTGGTVTNLGDIVAERGNVSIIGRAVNQSGRVRATTSVNRNGSIRLMAQDKATPSTFTDPSGSEGRKPTATRTGTLTFGAGSITEVQPDKATSATAPDGQAQPQSRIDAVGKTIGIGAGAKLLAPGGKVSLTATSNALQPSVGASADNRIQIAGNAVIDVSGDRSAVVEMERNQGSIKLFGNELADAPAQRKGPLARQEVFIDLRKGSAITDVTPLRERILRSVGERLSSGGDITLNAFGGDVVAEPGSVLAFAGGQVRYLDGYLSTSKLVTTDGRIVDIGNADPRQAYAGIWGQMDVNHRKWGVNEVFTVSANGALAEFHPGYVEGHDAGSLAIVAARTVLAGTLRGDVVRGTLQRDPATGLATGVSRPYTQVPLQGLLDIGGIQGDVRFTTAGLSESFGPASVLPEDLVLSTQMFERSGINRLALSVGGEIALRSNVTLSLAPGADVDLTGEKIDVDGTIRASGGRVALATSVPGGAITLGSKANIDVSGGWVNDGATVNGGVAGTAPLFVDGGEVAIAAQGNLTLAAGSRIDVSGGAHLGSDGLEAGAAGSIELESRIIGQATPTVLDLRGDLVGYGLEQGGSVALTAAAFRIGGPAVGTAPGTVVLPTSFFGRNGIAHYSMTADRGGVTVVDGATVSIKPVNRQLDASYAAAPTGTALSSFADDAILPDYLRGTSSFTATVARTANFTDDSARITVGRGARVETEIGGEIALTADTDIVVDGALVAPAGAISLSLRLPNAANDNGYRADQAIRLGAGSLLSTRAATRIVTSDLGFRTGDVLDGGDVSIDARRGYVFTADGSIIDVSGTAATIDLPTGPFAAREARLIASDAGAIDVRSAEGGVLAGTLRARGGGRTADGGSFTARIDTSRRDPNNTISEAPGKTQFPTVDPKIVVGDGRSDFPAIGEVAPAAANGRLFVDADELMQGGVTAARFGSSWRYLGNQAIAPGAVRLDGGLALDLARQIVLDADAIDIGAGTATLDAAYVALGPTQDILRNTGTPTAGSGRLVVNADHVDLIGTFTLNGLSGGGADALTIRSRGDIRLVGTRRTSDTQPINPGALKTTGNISLGAAQIYPTTLSDFDISVIASDGRIRIARSGGSSPLPLSAAGSVTLSAASIEQGGVLRAPFGNIDLDAADRLSLLDGSITSTSGAGLVVPFGVLQIGTDWVYPLGAFTRIFEQAPAKTIGLNAPDIDVRRGAIVDLRGGGDLLTYEFVKGPGGSRDILLGDNPDGAFAILPGRASDYGVIDNYESPSAGIDVGSTITLAAGAGVAAGEYAILPARYALVPGAYLLTPLDDTQDIQPGVTQTLSDGVTAVVAGKLSKAGTAAEAGRWTGFSIENGAQVRQRAEYNERLASRHFAGSGTPADAGRLTVKASNSIRLDGALAAAAAAGGRGAEVDFVGDRLSVVGERTSRTDRVELVDSELSRLGASSLLLGGTRQTDGARSTLNISANTVTVESGADVEAPEVLLAARQEVTVEAGASVAGTDAGDRPKVGEYVTSGDGAFLRVSSGEQATVARSNASGTSGRVTIAEGASLRAARSITLEASADVRSSGDLSVDGGSISLTASRISLGDANGITTGLVLSNADLARLRAAELLLNSASTIDLYGAVNASLEAIGIDGAGLRGFDNDQQRAAFNVGDLTLGNRRGLAVAGAGTGGGTLEIAARSVTLAGGGFEVSGFSDVSLNVAGQVAAIGESGLTVRGDLAIATPRITAGAGADVAITATGELVTMLNQAPANQQPVTALGARLRLAADSIEHGSRIVLPSGIVAMTASGPGGVTLASGSVVDVSGRDIAFDEVVVGSPGGKVLLRAPAGDVRIADGASVSVAGAPSGGDAGIVNVGAGNAADIDVRAAIAGAAAASARQGTFAVAAQALTQGFSALNAQLNASGFGERRDLQLGTGDIVIAADEVVKTRELNFIADGGAIDVAGRIDAAASDGGRVRLSARDDVTLRGSARIDARATGVGQDGGVVELQTMAGRIDLQATDSAGESTVSVGGAADNGRVLIRAPRIGNNGVAIESLAGRITGAERIDIEATAVYDGVASVNASTLAPALGESDAYMANATAIETALGVAGDSRYHLLAGIEVRNSGDMAISGIDLVDRRPGGEPGILTLRAGGNLTISGALNDGIRLESVAGQAEREVVQDDDSWSYRLVAGANAASADVMATASSGDLIINAPVRTGTGRIDMAAAGDISLNAAVATVGRNRGIGTLDPVDVEKLVHGDFVADGGSISLRSGGKVVGTSTATLPDWLQRIGGINELYNIFNGKPDGFRLPAGWAIDVSKFTSGVGALGGGDVRMEVGSDLTAVAVALPTNGLPTSSVGGEPAVAGGGDLDVRAGGDIRDSSFLLGRGTADIRADGRIVGDTAAGGGTVLQLADARAALRARTGVALDAAYNFTTAPSDPNLLVDFFIPVVPDTFVTYSPTSAVALQTLAGETVIAGRGTAIAQANGRPDTTGLTGLYPASLRAASLQGDVVIDGTVNLMPSTAGQLELLAHGSVRGNGRVVLSDGDVQLLPRVQNPSASFTDVDLARILAGHAPTPVHAADDQPARIVALNGSIGPLTAFEALRFDIAKQARVFAGRDVSNIRLAIQHARNGDISVIESGRDIIFPTLRQANGSLQDVRGAPIEVAGPGRLDLLAGRDVDLGLSDGVISIGNTSNPALPDGGVDISIWTGRAGKPDVRGFIDTFLVKPEYAAALRTFMAAQPSDAARSDIENFRALPEYRQRELVQTVFYNELRQSGIATTEGGNDFSRGFKAIETLFPAAGNYKGDFKAFLSRVSTLDGGDINLMVPGGLVNAGVASSAGIEKSADRLGIVVQREGDINAFVRDDFLVNASRVFALDGGDIMIWSSEADIDAGRGAKAALSIPPPVVSFDANGNVIVELPAAISGSGIRTAVSSAGRSPGDVFLFAPSGTVNAGDAGIESAGNITVAAVQVIGADNISAGGTSVGVPTVSTGSLAAGLTGAGDVASAATKSVTEAAAGNQQADDGKAAKDAAKALASALTFISVEFLGYGEG